LIYQFICCAHSYFFEASGTFFLIFPTLAAMASVSTIVAATAATQVN
jgi:hypothetical protein